MTLSFPNPSRSFEAPRNRVRFWGYDSSIEITFFVDAGTLEKLCPGASTVVESGVLRAFDSALQRIHAAAAKAYGRAQRGTCAFSLMEADFAKA